MKPRVCGACRAFTVLDFQVSCLLGHHPKAKSFPTKFGIPLVRGVPQEPCEKPMTNDELCRLQRERTP
jgi:hypothetical protein